MVSSTYMGIYVLRGKLVKVQQSLVHLLLQLQCTLHGFQPTAPLITLRFLQQKGNYHTLDITNNVLHTSHTIIGLALMS